MLACMKLEQALQLHLPKGSFLTVLGGSHCFSLRRDLCARFAKSFCRFVEVPWGTEITIVNYSLHGILQSFISRSSGFL